MQDPRSGDLNKEDGGDHVEIRFNEDDHSYWLEDARLISVTQLIDKYIDNPSKAFWKESDAHRGRVLHAATVALDKGEEPWLYGDFDLFTEAYKLFLAEEKPDWLFREQVVYNPKFMYAGTLDGFGTLNGKIGQGQKGVLDIKTGRPQAEAKLQLAGYTQCLHPPKKDDMGFILELKKTGKYKLYPVELAEHHRGWHGLCEFHQWRTRYGSA